MAALATIPDLVARVGPLTPEQTARAPALLLDASEDVRDYTGQRFDLVNGDSVVLQAGGLVLTLPQRPVISVTSVALIDGSTDIPLTGWAWNGLDEIDLAQATAATSRTQNTATYRVVYSHGYTTVPDRIIGVVCGVANRVLTAPSVADGIVAETIGQYSYQLQQGVGGGGSSTKLTGADKDKLARYRRRSVTVTVRAR